MFEVIVTSRPDFREQVVDCCPRLEEAQEIAARLSAQCPERFIRVWIRRAHRMSTSCTRGSP
jgi:hypothetical protein